MPSIFWKASNVTIGLLELPEEMIEHIVSLVSLQDLKNLSRTNKTIFRITEKYIAIQSVINPSRGEEEKNLCDLRELKRRYFNLRVDDSFNDSMIQDIPNVIPKNVYIGTNLITASQTQFCEYNDFVETVFINVHYSKCRLYSYMSMEFALTIPHLTRALTKIYSCTGTLWDSFSFFRRFPNTLNIEASSLHIEHVNWEKLRKINNIKKITMVGQNFRSTGNLFKYFSKLRHLELRNCRATDFDGKFIQYLDTLSLSEMKISKKMLTNLAEFSKLSVLNFEDCTLDENFTFEDFVFLKNIQHLKVESDWLPMIGLHLRKVESLQVVCAGSFDPPNITLSRLKNLIISGKKFTEQNSTELKKMKAPNLEFLDLPDIFECVPSCQSLRIRKPIEVIIERSGNIFGKETFNIPKIFLNSYFFNSKLLFMIASDKGFQNTVFHIDLLLHHTQGSSPRLLSILKVAEQIEGVSVKYDEEDRKTLIIENGNSKLMFYEKEPKTTHDETHNDSDTSDLSEDENDTWDCI